MIRIDNKKKLWLLVKILAIGSILSISLLVLIERHYRSKYPFVVRSEYVAGKIIEVKPYQSVAMVKLQGGKTFALTTSRNYSYEPYDLNEFIGVGDSLVKKKNSDTLFVKKENAIFYFVLGEFINRND